MPIFYDITKDYLFIKGREEGRQEGRQEGREEALVREKMIVKNMLNEKFEVENIIRIMEVSKKYIEEIKKEINEKK